MFFAGLLVLTIVGAWLAIRAAALPGQREDDGVYLVTAKALAEGKGYRHLQLPGEPLQTKYPILYPFVLSLIWRVAPHFPANLLWIQALNAACSFGAFTCAYFLMRRAWRAPPAVIAAGVLLAATNPLWVAQLQVAMSEQLFALLSIAALLVAAPHRSTAGRRSRPGMAGLAAGVLAGLAFLTRTIGVAAAAAVVIALAAQRRWRDAFISLVISAACIAGWGAWRSAAATENAENSAAAAFGYDLDYGGWLPKSAGEAVRVAYLNSADMAFSLFAEVGFLPLHWAMRTLAQGDLGLLWVAIVVTLAFCLLGLVLAVRRQSVVLHAYLLMYLLFVLVWPFSPTTRFFLPILPFLTTATVLAIAALLSLFFHAANFAGKDLKIDGGQRGWIHWHARGVMVAAALVLILASLWLQRVVKWSRSETDARLAAQRALAVETVRDHTPESAIVAGAQGAYFFLATQRKFVPVIPITNSIDVYYTPDRTWARAGRGGTEDEVRFYLELAQHGQLEYYQQIGVTHAIWSGPPQPWEGPLPWFGRMHPGTLEPLARVAGNPTYELYRVALPQPD